MQDIITYTLIIIAAGILAVRIYHTMTGKRKCNGCSGCNGCSAQNECNNGHGCCNSGGLSGNCNKNNNEKINKCK